MIVNQEKWTIVLAGLWNLAIFNPEWLGTHIFDSQDVSMEFPVVPGLPIRITSDEVTIIPSANTLMLNPISQSEAALLSAESKACKILELLPHTPLAGIGINFGFREDDPEADLLREFAPFEASRLTEGGFAIMNTGVKRRLMLDRQVINISIDVDSPAINLLLNFHSDVQDSAGAQSAIKDRVLANRNTAIDMLSSIYGLSMEER